MSCKSSGGTVWGLIAFSLFFSRWTMLTLNTALQGKRRSALHLMLTAPAGIRSLWLPLIQGTAPRAGAYRHPTTGWGESKVLAWRTTESSPLLSPPPVLSLPPHLFLPRPWLPPSVCLRKHTSVSRRQACHALLLWVVEDAASQRQAEAWGRTQLQLFLKRFRLFLLLRLC